MLDRHAVQELVRAGVTARAIAKQFGVSVRMVRRILREGAVEGTCGRVAAGCSCMGFSLRDGFEEARTVAARLRGPPVPPT